ncbi:DUF6412 domain-containing protein [Sphaerisporangium fuscum]|uniref:DUF6412 domain-containing protein n=1 Tax=Sphaerisporangium fuscum TaxID=2835868 RepID=UPI001BDDB76A|nr:DUF6412 domain-containing protein [Sphaerisporangium fuscum]
MTAFHTTVAMLGQLLAGSPGMLTAVGFVGVTLLLFAWALGRLAAVPAVAARPGLRSRAAHSVFVRQRHPDSAGRPRPRAPSAGPAPA